MAAKSAVVAPNSNARTLLIGIAVLMGVCLASLIIAGATSLISLAERIHPVAGTIAFWGICLAAGSARTAEGDLWAEARGVSASVARSTGE